MNGYPLILLLLIGLSPDATLNNILHPPQSGDGLNQSRDNFRRADVLWLVKMKMIPLSRSSSVAIVDDSAFEYLSQFGWFATARGYAGRSVMVNGKWKILLMHRDILNLKPGEFVDHINHNGFDNQSSNLRRCTFRQNMYNRRKRSHNTTGYKGVFFDKRRRHFFSYIIGEGGRKYLGSFPDSKSAALAYNKAAVLFHGQFANLNNL